MRSLTRDRRGVASVEYGILAAGVIAAVLLAMTTFSTALQDAYTSLGTYITTSIASLHG